MSLYAIGDIQGCFSTLQALLNKINFDSKHDRLWLVGDLVNRGADSLQTLRWIYNHRDVVTTVLGNHDFHLLACGIGARTPKHNDTLDDILTAPDKDELLTWLRHQPLLYEDGDYMLVHAGILPTWNLEQARHHARQLEQALQGDQWQDILTAIYTSSSEDTLDNPWYTIANFFTRLRFCTADAVPDYQCKVAPQDAPKHLSPWFELTSRPLAHKTIVFGHWSSLGLYVTPHLIALDSGCVWGNSLTAIRLPDRQIFQIPSQERSVH